MPTSSFFLLLILGFSESHGMAKEMLVNNCWASGDFDCLPELRHIFLISSPPQNSFRAAAARKQKKKRQWINLNAQATNTGELNNWLAINERIASPSELLQAHKRGEKAVRLSLWPHQALVTHTYYVNIQTRKWKCFVSLLFCSHIGSGTHTSCVSFNIEMNRNLTSNGRRAGGQRVATKPNQQDRKINRNRNKAKEKKNK